MTTPTIPDVALPAAMVEAAARGLPEVEDLAADTFDELDDRQQEWCRVTARALLAAALSVCEIREEEGYRLRHIGYVEDQLGLDRFGGEGWARRCVAAYAVRAEEPGYAIRATLLRHFVITTPAEPVDPTVEQP